MSGQEFTYTFSETFHGRLLDNGRIVLTDANGLRAIAVDYPIEKRVRYGISSYLDRVIVDAMLDASLPYDPSEDQDGGDDE